MKVKLHNTHPDAANATDATIKALPGGTYALKRLPNGDVDINTEGFVEVEASNPDFLKFACLRQGYVAEVRD